MSEVMELAGSFASACREERIKPRSRMTLDAISSEMIEPENCVELSTDDIEYITGEWGWFANHNLKYTCAWNDASGYNWLLSKAGVPGTAFIIGTVGGEVSFTYSLFYGIAFASTAGLAAAALSAGLLVVHLWDSILGKDAYDKAQKAEGYIKQFTNYKVFENTVMWNTVVNGYDVEPW